MKYNKQILNIFFNALMGDERAKLWLYENDYPELTAFVNSLFGLENAEKWLVNSNQYKYLGYLSRAIKRDANALLWLIEYGFEEEAATVGMIHEKTSCEQWLLAEENYPYIKMGEILRHKF